MGSLKREIIDLWVKMLKQLSKSTQLVFCDEEEKDATLTINREKKNGCFNLYIPLVTLAISFHSKRKKKKKKKKPQHQAKGHGQFSFCFFVSLDLQFIIIIYL